MQALAERPRPYRLSASEKESRRKRRPALRRTAQATPPANAKLRCLGERVLNRCPWNAALGHCRNQLELRGWIAMVLRHARAAFGMRAERSVCGQSGRRWISRTCEPAHNNAVGYLVNRSRGSRGRIGAGATSGFVPFEPRLAPAAAVAPQVPGPARTVQKEATGTPFSKV
jgi:hypothetical protein